MKITINDLAKATGFSKTTVSHALNEKGAVNKHTRALIKQKAQEMGYIPDAMASQLRTGQRNTIAIISTMPLATSNSKAKLGFLFSIIAEVAHSAFEQGYSLVAVPPITQLSDLKKLNNIAGAILVEPTNDDVSVEFFQTTGIPYVSIGSTQQIKDNSRFVNLNYEAITVLLIKHLVEQGCQHIGLIIGQSNRFSQQATLMKYKQLMLQYELPTYICYGDESEGKGAGNKAAKFMLEQYPKLDGICVLIDTFAEGVMEELIYRKINMPEDVKVCTRYDGIIAQTSQPALTAVDLSLDRAAQQALVKLINQITNQVDGQTELNKIIPKLITRQSTLG